ncbi:hypothetical protein PG995_012222 [Apiospora arundinis]
MMRGNGNEVDQRQEEIVDEEAASNASQLAQPSLSQITTPHQSPPAAYSAFTRSQKRWIIPIAALAGWFSTASSFIYFPAIPLLAQDLGVSVQNINLTVTSYLIASGIFPSITGSLADRHGRRWAFIASLGVYAAVNLGLALQHSFPVLFVLRMLQSAAVSGTFSIAYGVVGDLTTPAEKGRLYWHHLRLVTIHNLALLRRNQVTGLTNYLLSLNTPPSVAPLISGLLLIRWTWPAIFWFLLAATCVALGIMVLLMPETCRLIVGDGTIAPSRARRPLFKALLPKLQQQHRPKASQMLGEKIPVSSLARLANLFSALTLLKNKGTFMVILCYAIYYTVYSCLQATLSTVFVEVYNVSGLVAGLCYIPFGVACSIASFIAGKTIDRDYAKTALERGPSANNHGHSHIVPADFPIEYARFRTNKYFIVATVPLIVAYGWTLQIRSHIAVPLILQFLIGFTNQSLFTSLNTLLVDYYPGKSASAQAANNLVRCEMAATGLAVVDIMIQRLGVGWCFVVFAVLHAITLPLIWALERKGIAWRPRKSL